MEVSSTASDTILELQSIDKKRVNNVHNKCFRHTVLIIIGLAVAASIGLSYTYYVQKSMHTTISINPPQIFPDSPHDSLDKLRSYLSNKTFPANLLNITDFGAVVFARLNGDLHVMFVVIFHGYKDAFFLITPTEIDWINQLLQLNDNQTVITAIRNADDLECLSEYWSYHTQSSPNIDDKWILFIKWLFNKWRQQIPPAIDPTKLWLDNQTIPTMKLCELIKKAPNNDMEDVLQISWQEWFDSDEYFDKRVIRVCDSIPWHFMTVDSYKRAQSAECFRCRGTQTLQNHSIWRIVPS